LTLLFSLHAPSFVPSVAARHVIFDTKASLDRFLERALSDCWLIEGEMPRITAGRRFWLVKNVQKILVTQFPNHGSVVEDGRHSK
jgi:hypothetical protein